MKSDYVTILGETAVSVRDTIVPALEALPDDTFRFEADYLRPTHLGVRLNNDTVQIFPNNPFKSRRIRVPRGAESVEHGEESVTFKYKKHLYELFRLCQAVVDAPKRGE